MSAYDHEPGESPVKNTYHNGSVAVKNGYADDMRSRNVNNDFLSQLGIDLVSKSLNEKSDVSAIYKGQIEILRTECESQSRKIQELNAEISRIRREAVEEVAEIRTKYEDELSKLKEELSSQKSDHRDKIADLKDEVRKLEFEKNHSSTWMDRIMDNAPEVIPMIQKLFEQPAHQNQLATPTQSDITPQNSAEMTNNPMNDAPKTKAELVAIILNTAQTHSLGQFDPSVNYAAAIDGMIAYGRNSGWAFNAEDYVSLAEQMIQFAVDQGVDPQNIAESIQPFFAEVKAIKTAAKLMSVDQITDLLLSQANIDAQSYPDSHLAMLKQVVTHLKKLL